MKMNKKVIATLLTAFATASLLSSTALCDEAVYDGESYSEPMLVDSIDMVAEQDEVLGANDGSSFDTAIEVVENQLFTIPAKNTMYKFTAAKTGGYMVENASKTEYAGERCECYGLLYNSNKEKIEVKESDAVSYVLALDEGDTIYFAPGYKTDGRVIYLGSNYASKNNNSIETAEVLEFDKVMQGCVGNNYLDKEDYYKFHVKYTGMYDIRLNGRLASNDYMLLNSNGERHKTMWTSDGPILDPGDYYIRVYGDTTRSYELKVRFAYRFNVEELNEKTDVTDLKDFVNSLYLALLDRSADESGVNNWANKLADKSANASEIIEGIVKSDEFKNKNLSNEEIVEKMYQSMLGRTADTDGKNNWVGKLNEGYSVNAIINGFSGSEEFGSVCNKLGIEPGKVADEGIVNKPNTPDENNKEASNDGVREFVKRCYVKALGREAEENGLNDWTNRILSKTWTPEEVASTGFFNSQEFGNKNTSNEQYVEILYRTFLGREYDQAGFDDWVGQLNNGKDRNEVLKGFSRSVEFANIMASYGL